MTKPKITEEEKIQAQNKELLEKAEITHNAINDMLAICRKQKRSHYEINYLKDAQLGLKYITDNNP
jgi:hypothetical protein